MNVAEIMTPRESLVTATLPGSREDVLDRLQDNEFSSVPVVNGDTGAFRGLVSRERLIADPEEDQLALLAEDVPTIPGDATLASPADEPPSRDTRTTTLPDSLDGRVISATTCWPRSAVTA